MIRHPEENEVPAMLALFADEVVAGRMLPRNADTVRHHLDEWLVATDEGHIVGCVSLVAFHAELCEVRSLAVDEGYQGQGLGTQLVEAMMDMAQKRGFERVLTLTRATRLFEQLGFRRVPVADFPAKVLTDCAPCPLKHACDEIALVLDLTGDIVQGDVPAIPFYAAAGGEL